MGGEPLHRWARPSIVIQNEANYSDAHIFPWAYQTLGVGKLVGTPVAGTGTAVWWERQIDPTLVFGIPQVGFVDMQGRYLENQELKPDILVYNDANARQSGKDPQLEAAVAELMKQLGDR
jgi:C-terminal processing protease CtpA/Prc